MVIEQISSPAWADPSQTAIRFVVKFSDNSETEGLVARADDPPTADFYTRALAGEFGPIGGYTPPPEPEE